MRSATPRIARGFSLLEVIIAFAVLALCLTLLMSSLGDALGGVRWAAQDQRALAWAQSHLDQMGVLGPLELGEREGDWEDGGFRYVEKVSLVPDPLPLPPSASPITPAAPSQVLVHIQLDVRWGSGEGREHLSVSTLRLRNAAEFPDAELPR